MLTVILVSNIMQIHFKNLGNRQIKRKSHVVSPPRSIAVLLRIDVITGEPMCNWIYLEMWSTEWCQSMMRMATMIIILGWVLPIGFPGLPQTRVWPGKCCSSCLCRRQSLWRLRGLFRGLGSAVVCRVSADWGSVEILRIQLCFDHLIVFPLVILFLPPPL